MTSSIKNADVFDFTIFKMKKVILDTKRNPKKTQAEVRTLEACLELYLTDTIYISWLDGDPYMQLNETSDLDEDELKEKFNQLINGV